MSRRFFLVHLSDLHIGGPKHAVSLSALTGAVKRKLSDLRMSTGRPVYLFITGDLVSEPSKKAINAACAYVEELQRELPLSAPPMVVPGNHDVKLLGGNGWTKDEPFFEAFPHSRGVWHKSFNPEGLEVIGVDSNGSAKFARGELSKASYDSLLLASNDLAAKVREANKEHTEMDVGRLRVLAIHHHPLPLAEGEGFKELGFIPDEGFMYLQSPATFLSAALSFGCHLILHGHRHVAGLTRYSVPRNGHFSRDVLLESEAWSTLYVLSCPSSTGVNCEAGFNILEFTERDGPNSFQSELRVYRFTRPRNREDFVPHDRRGSTNCIRLPLGEEVQRDVAVNVYWRVSALDGDVDRNVLLREASVLFRRRAFALLKEEDWAEALYVYAATANAWAEVHVRLSGGNDQAGAEAVAGSMRALQDACQVALNLDGMTFDVLRKLVYDRYKFDAKVPRTGNHETMQRGLAAKGAALLRLRSGLQDLGVGHWLPDDDHYIEIQ